MQNNQLFDHHRVVTTLLSDSSYLKPPKVHKEILGLYQNNDRLQSICCPVGFAKSTTLKSYLTRQLMRAKNYDKFILYVSSTATKVADQFTGIAKIIQTKELQQIYKYKVVEANQSTITIQMENGEKRRISGVASGQDISGINFENARPSLIGVDDIEELDTAKSIMLTEKLIEWINTTLISRLPSLAEGKVRMIGTNLTQNSIINRIMTNAADKNGSKVFANWKWHKYQALDHNNQSIWEERHPTKYLLEEQIINPYTFASNYMNEPLNMNDSLIKQEYLRYYEQTPELLSSVTQSYIHIDPTHTGKQTSDYFAIGIVGQCKDNYKNLIDFHLEKCDVETQARIIINFYIKWKHLSLKKMTYDAIAQDGLGMWIKKLAREEYNISTPLEPIKVNRDKVAHFSPHLPAFISNSFRLPNNFHNPIMMQELTTQLMTFPSGRHDDAVDMISGCLDGFNSQPVFQSMTREEIKTQIQLVKLQIQNK